ncbi:MAG: hypothetical protein AB7S26_22705 [Sandaracinaceae bacterium]
MRRLMPCTGCQRHIAIDAVTCPFCDAEVVVVSTPGVPRQRLGRAALFAFGAAALATGCGESHGPDDAGTDAGNVAPPYGIPPDDAGPPPGDDAGPGEDAGPGDAGQPVNLYGGAP